ncbi:KamA family radical SAM protein [Aggregicoccus sp. 17bor-14]|uniref:KamA family radical SAM protein n=1 Tax=Myxococcaceae TaxID=31 RepID=UPI00129C38EB|nr:MULTISPECIES: KamA family radical SAM protein [Myxococcaceae]MBF5045508.1 KamA family radical SAM protein [Simulacricoccus sp. 17bor-14]MRI91245.1 KamA family radical SAM protein [Aggregicoccus sp. 17bor-14]
MEAQFPSSRAPASPASARHPLFADVSASDWGDWRWQMRHAVKSLEALERYVPLTADERAGVQETQAIFRMGISPYYLSLIDREHPFCPVRMQSIPARAEARVRPGELADPLGEDKTRPEEAIVHKYPDRVLFLALDTCSVYCRHCTRRRITKGGEAELSKEQMRRGIEYIRRHPEVRDVLISGGDPFLLTEARLEELLAPLSEIPHVEMIRIGTRIPVCLPMRVTDALARTLRRYAPVYVVTHFNHPKEITPEAREACERLVDHGVPVENQAVLMRRLNSDARIIKELSHRLLRIRVRPYYLHQMDVAEGCEHLRTPIAKGVEILEQLRGHTTGLAVPHLAVDLPGGGGKVTLQPDYVVERGASQTVFRNFKGERYAYPEPEETDCSCPYEETWQRQAASLPRR